jgi:hypothetical protein
MRTFLSATLLIGAMLCAVSFGQSAPSAQNPSALPSQPEAQPATTSPAQPAAPQATQPQQSSQTIQSPTAAPTAAKQEQTAGPHLIAPGSVIPVQLTQTIDAKKAKPGDEVVARVTMDLKTNTGEVIVPKDTKVVGHVTEAQARSKEQKESQVGIAFDRAVLKDGEVSLPMSIQAVIAPPSNDANSSGSYNQGTPTLATAGSTGSSPMGSGRTGSVGASQTQPSNPLPTAGTTASEGSGARPPITGNTQGVVGISNLKLDPAPSGAPGSVLSSEKNNVKVESGTILLLKVNQ